MTIHSVTRRALAVALVAAATALPAAAGNTGGLQLEVTGAGAAIEGATITITDPSSPSFKIEQKTDRRGRVSIIGLAPKEYRFRVDKEGFQSYESNFFAHAGENESKKVALTASAGGAPPAQGATPEKKAEPWSQSYNEGVALYQEGKDAEALARAEAALQAKPDYAPALTLKGLVLEREGKCEEAVPPLKQGLALNPEAKSSLGPLIRCLDKLGKKDEAATYRKAQAESGKSKTDLYNDAVTAINAGDDAAAGGCLEQALQQDPKFAPAIYQYALILFRRGDSAGAASRLESYLQIAPNGEFAADARDLLKALKP
jgi:tetratricopeptide (TPR) repeat protein